ncbi:MAG: hypothetical protein ACI4MI_03670 [Christensenellales bacterium]
MKTKSKEETKTEKQPGKLKVTFAILYFATTVASLIFYTISAIKDVVKEGWSPINIVMMAFIGLSYVILIACIILSKNVAGAKSTHSKAKKMLKLGRKSIKIVHAVPTVMVLVSSAPTGVVDMVTRVLSVLSLIMHIIGLITSINILITKALVKKVAKKGKEKIVAKLNDVKNDESQSADSEVVPLADVDNNN